MEHWVLGGKSWKLYILYLVLNLQECLRFVLFT